MNEKTTHPSVEIRQTVPFHDLDPMQVVWHGNYLKYFDCARFELFRSLGVDLYEFYENERYLFPIVKTYAKHIAPLRYGDEFVCKAMLKDAYIKIELAFEIRRVTCGTLCAKGKSDQVAIKMPEGKLMLKIPDEIRVALGF